jgi:Inhibitor of the KinA pathway to sporulation, predicted exonuclease
LSSLSASCTIPLAKKLCHLFVKCSREACDLLRAEYHTDSRPWASWGDYDRRQIQRQAVGGVRFPFSARHTNAKRAYAEAYSLRKAGMAQALAHAGLPLEGAHHRGADDAWNIAALVAQLVSEGHWPQDPT